MSFSFATVCVTVDKMISKLVSMTLFSWVSLFILEPSISLSLTGSFIQNIDPFYQEISLNQLIPVFPFPSATFSDSELLP